MDFVSVAGKEARLYFAVRVAVFARSSRETPLRVTADSFAVKDLTKLRRFGLSVLFVSRTKEAENTSFVTYPASRALAQSISRVSFMVALSTIVLVEPSTMPSWQREKPETSWKENSPPSSMTGPTSTETGTKKGPIPPCEVAQEENPTLTRATSQRVRSNPPPAQKAFRASPSSKHALSLLRVAEKGKPRGSPSVPCLFLKR